MEKLLPGEELCPCLLHKSRGAFRRRYDHCVSICLGFAEAATIDRTVPRVMGPTGSGKSSVRTSFVQDFYLVDSCCKFIGMATGAEIGIGHDLESYTTDIQIIRFQFVDINVVFVDTPGFDDTHKSDVEILDMIANWLNTTYVLFSGPNILTQ